jgi:hypothetical protein
LGPSNWNLPSISSGSGQDLTTQVFASPSLIGNSVFFTVNVQYIQNGHQERTSSFDLGAIVIGDIQLRVNNLGIRYIGNTPNLVGNILNEGNTPAQFASVEMLPQGQGQTQLYLPSSNNNITATLTPNSSQYLGNIGVNSPVPFNIPFQMQIPIANAQQQQNATTKGTSENVSRGQYPVSLKITYSDDLKNIHDVVVNSSLSLLDVQSTPLDGTNSNASPAAQQDAQLTSTNGFVDTYWAANTARITSGNNSVSSTLLPTEQDVGPGEGPSILAVVLSNTAFSNINGIIGYLTLPSGFSAVVGSGTSTNNVNQQQTATASYSNIVQSGQTYTLYFKVKIGKSATVGSHTATLKIYYFKVPELQPGQYSSQTFTIPFSLPGKVILDAVPKITSLNPGASNNARIQLVNKGTADAHSVIVTVTGISGNSISGSNVAGSGAQTVGSGNSGNSSNSSNITTGGQTTTTSPTSSIPTVNLGTRTFDIGTLPVNGTAEIDPTIYPSESAGGTLQNLNLQVSYSDANGNAKTSNFSVGYLVLPTPPEAGLSVTPSNGPPQAFSNSTSSSHSPSSSPSSNTTNLNNTSGGNNNNRNKSNNSSAGITVSPAYSESNLTAKAVNINDNGRNNEYTTTVPAIYKISRGSDNIGMTSAVGSDSKALSHGSSTSNNNNNINNASNDSLNSTSLTIVAGSVQDMKFNVANNNNFPITNVVVSIASQSSDVKIVGDSLWSLPLLPANTAHTFSTKIYASTSLIGSPVSFLVTTQYISGAQSKMGSFILGGNVVGDIRVSVTDLAVNYVAGVPNLVGNLLNQGNTIGLFTTVQLMNQPFSSSNSSSSSSAVSGGQSVNQQHHIHSGGGGGGRSGVSTQSSSTNSSSSISSALPPPQYLGDLQPDSPLPFSIPLGIDLNSTAPGTYPVSIKVTYSDDLKKSHDIVLNGPVQIKPQQPRGSSDQGGGIFSFLGIGGGGGSHGRGGHGGGGNTGVLGIPLLYLIIIIAAVVIAAIYLRRRRRSKSTKVITSENEEGEITDDVDKEEDIESLIDSSKSGDSDNKGRGIGTSKQ